VTTRKPAKAIPPIDAVRAVNVHPDDDRKTLRKRRNAGAATVTSADLS